MAVDDNRLVQPAGAQTSVQDGTGVIVGASRNGSLRVVYGGASRSEAAQRNKLFYVTTAQAGVTIIAEMAGTIAADKKTILSVENPVGSTVDLHLHEVIIGHVSGTPGAGAFSLQHVVNTTAPTGTYNITPRATRVGSSKGVAHGWSNTATTGTGAHVLLMNLPVVPFAGALAATHTTMSPVVYPVDGAIVIPPGGFLSIAAAATGTSHVVTASMLYEEVPYTGV